MDLQGGKTMNEVKTIYALVRIDYTEADDNDIWDVAQLVADRAAQHNDTVECGVKVDNVDIANVNY